MFSNIKSVCHFAFKNLNFGKIILADDINGRASATVLRPSVVCLSITYVLWLNSESYEKKFPKKQIRNSLWGIE